MMDYKQRQMEKERQKALNDLLVAECKGAQTNFESIRNLLAGGADICYKFAEPLRWAAKLGNFPLVKFLIENGALAAEISLTYIAKMCDHKFSDESEPQFFEILDIAKVKAGGDIALFAPYINHMALAGRLSRLYNLMERYGLTESEVCAAVENRVIFELVQLNHDETLAFIERHRKWITPEAFDGAVAGGEWIVLEYMLNKDGYQKPSDTAVAKAVYDGYFEVLDILTHNGYDFERKSLFLEKACRAAYSRGTKSLEYLLKHGYTVLDVYRGKTVLENAEADKNEPLLRFLGA
ncbi:MAG: hypothetical protein FWD58_10700 [Firmicutes bacterium]|nr:hypothetical protein [Bacillota bacterium]